MLYHIKQFSQNPRNPMHILVVEDLLLREEELEAALQPSGPSVNRNILQVIEQQHGLNERRNEAMRLAMAKRLSLIQGPPGTGKTLTA